MCRAVTLAPTFGSVLQGPGRRDLGTGPTIAADGTASTQRRTPGVTIKSMRNGDSTTIMFGAGGARPAMKPGTIETMVMLLLRYPKAMATALRMLRPGHFCRPGEAYLEALVAAIIDLAPEYPAGIPYTRLWEEMRERVDHSYTQLPEEEARLLLDQPEDVDPENPADKPGLIYRAYHDDDLDDQDDGYVIKQLKRFLTERAVDEPLRQSWALAGDGVARDLGMQCEQAQRTLAQIDALDRMPVSMRDAFPEFEARLDRGLGRRFLGVQTGLEALDDKTQGLRGVTILGAPPNTGKTTLVTQLGVGVARHAETNQAVVVILSLDMPRKVLYERILSHLSKLPYLTVVKGSPSLRNNATGPYRTTEDQEAYDRAKTELLQEGIAGRIMIYDRESLGSGVTAARLRQILADAKELTGTQRALLIVDYLQLLPVPDAVSSQGDLAVARYQVEMLQDAIAAPEEKPDWERDAVLAVSEVRKRVNNAHQQAPLSIDDLISSTRLGYAAECVLLLGPMTDPDLVEAQAIPPLDKDLRKKSIAVRRNAYADRHVSPMTLQLVKARDGMYRGKIYLEFAYEQSRMTPVEARPAPTPPPAAPEARATESRNEPPEQLLVGTGPTERRRRLLEAYAGLPEEERATGISKKKLATAAGNMNRVSAGKELALLVADGLMEAVPVPGRDWCLYRVVAGKDNVPEGSPDES
jgi:replicative DNA helicase